MYLCNSDENGSAFPVMALSKQVKSRRLDNLGWDTYLIQSMLASERSKLFRIQVEALFNEY